MQYLYYAHGFGGSLPTLLKNILDCGTFAEPSRYLYSIFTMHMVFGGISANPIETIFGLWHFCRAIKILVQYLHYAHGVGGISVNPVEQNFGLWHFCRAIKILVQYLYYAHGFGRISVNPVEKINWTVALLQSHKDTCAVSLLCTRFGGDLCQPC